MYQGTNSMEFKRETAINIQQITNGILRKLINPVVNLSALVSPEQEAEL